METLEEDYGVAEFIGGFDGGEVGCAAELGSPGEVGGEGRGWRWGEEGLRRWYGELIAEVLEGLLLEVVACVE